MGKANKIETYVLELMNRMRLDPGGEFDRTFKNAKKGIAHDKAVTEALEAFGVDINKVRKEYARLEEAPVLAWNNDLHDAALKHSRLQAKQDTQSHQLPGEQPLLPRVQKEGYDVKLVGENVFAFSETAEHAHQGMAIDYGPNLQGRILSDGLQPGRGHRVNIMRDDFREVGVSMLKENKKSTSVGPYVMTQNFGTTQDDEAIITGVAYRDRDKDGWYSMNEGQRGLKINVQGEGRDVGGQGGNYNVVTGEGVMSVTLSGKPVKGRIKAEIDMGQDNVKLDVVDKTILK
ncbi:MAG: CAP domain-containing protein, partial [Pseudomonadota bacterium]